jgi:hypothetical protein
MPNFRARMPPNPELTLTSSAIMPPLDQLTS